MPFEGLCQRGSIDRSGIQVLCMDCMPLGKHEGSLLLRRSSGCFKACDENRRAFACQLHRAQSRHPVSKGMFGTHAPGER